MTVIDVQLETLSRSEFVEVSWILWPARDLVEARDRKLVSEGFLGVVFSTGPSRGPCISVRIFRCVLEAVTSIYCVN